MLQPLLSADDNDVTEGSGLPEGQPRAAGRSEAEPAAIVSSRSYLSRLTFGWVSPLLRRGSTQPQLHQRDLFELPANLHPAACGRLLRRRWQEEQERQRLQAAGGFASADWSLLRAVVAAYGWPFFKLGTLKAAGDALNFAGPLLLNLLLKNLAAAPAVHPHASGGAAASSALRLAGGHLDMKTPLFGFGCAALLAASLMLKAFVGAHFSFRQSLIASQLRSAVTVAVFQKALAVNAATLAAAGSGRVQTLMSVDADRVVNLCLSFHELWSLPLQIAVALWLLYTQVQYAFLAGLALVLLLIPVNRWLARRIQAASISMMGAKDRRVQTMLEILRGIRQIKSCAWEAAFARRVVDVRHAELASLAVRKYLDALCVYFWAATSLLFSLTTFGLYALLGRQLTPAIVFTSLALFNVLLAPINAFPWVINGVVEALVSVRRVSEFLQAPETSGPTLLSNSGSPEADAPAIHVRGSYSWGSGDSQGSGGPVQDCTAAGFGSQPSDGAASEQQWRSGGGTVLLDVELAVPAGTLVALTGPVGSGKSSLLAAVLGDMLQAAPGDGARRRGGCPSSGCVAAGSSVAYVPQDPWLMHGTLRENVLLGRPCCKQRYAAVLHACALLPDLKEMPAGDLTVVGGGGATLSGGQCARLALARALYKEPDVLLLDDCLAAVDSRVAAWILQHALLGPLLWGQVQNSPEAGQQPRGNQARAVQHSPGDAQKDMLSNCDEQRPPRQRRQTVVVASHTPALLAAADMVVTMQGGRVGAVLMQPEAAAARQRAAAAAAVAAETAMAEVVPCTGDDGSLDLQMRAAAGTANAGAGRAQQEAEVQLEAQQGHVSDEGREERQQQGQQAERQQGQQHERHLERQDEQQERRQEEQQEAEGQEEEERQLGHVRWAVYRQYAGATGQGWVAFILTSLLLMQVSRNGSDLWLSHWVSQTTPPAPSPSTCHQPQIWWSIGGTSSGNGGGGSDPYPAAAAGLHVATSYPACSHASGGDATGCDGATASAASLAAFRGVGAGRWTWGRQLDPLTRFYLSVLLAIAAANSFVTLIRAFSFAKGGLVAAKRVHERLLGAVLALPLSFFDATPPGRILNRFSSDTATVDDSLPFILNILLANIASLAGVAVVLCLTQPLVLAVLPPLAFAYRRLQRYYRATSRELRRLDAVARSPVYSAFSEVLSGGPTIRAFAAQPHFLAAAEAAVAAQQRAAVSSAAAGSWLALRLQLMAAALAAAVAGAAVAEHAGLLPRARPLAPATGTAGSGSGMAAGLVGLSLSYVLPITGLLSALLTTSAETEQEMVAAERVFQYLELPGSSKNCSSSDSLAHDVAMRAAMASPGRPSARCTVAEEVGSCAVTAAPAAAAAAAAAAGRDLEAQQPLLRPAVSPCSLRMPPAVLEGSSSSSDWLHSGTVRFEDVWMRYEPWSGTAVPAASAHSGPAGSSSCSVDLPPAPGHLQASNSGSRSSGGGIEGGGGRPWVLRGLCLEVQAGSHLGICGRTGAGKSSLLAALLRLAPIASGRILIDGRDCAAIPVAMLRRAVGVVPQHPFLFEGTIAQNLDPLDLHTHDELVAVLHQVELWPALLAQLPRSRLEAAAGGSTAGAGAASPAGIAAAAAWTCSANGNAAASQQQRETSPPAPPEQRTAEERRVLAVRLGEGCAALSLGQQQLLALARVLLRRPRLLLLDEATSSVDPATADTMHQVIRSHLAGATILEVAHRESTIAGCDRVVVMEAGRVAEEGQ